MVGVERNLAANDKLPEAFEAENNAKRFFFDLRIVALSTTEFEKRS